MSDEKVVPFGRGQHVPFVNSAPPPGTDPYVEGKAKCLDCKHGWHAVAPAGVVVLECPKCETMRGVWVHTVSPGVGGVYVCNCGNDLFSLHDVGAPLCVRCGTRATSWVEG